MIVYLYNIVSYYVQRDRKYRFGTRKCCMINSLQGMVDTSEKEKVGIMEQWTVVEQQKQTADKHVSELQVYIVLCVCVCLSVCLSALLSVCPSVCPPVHLSTCPSVCLSI